jgi:hypothetical protein
MGFQMDNALWWTSIACGAFALGSLSMRGLVSRYPWFGSYLVFNLIRNLSMKCISGSPANHTYALVYFVTEPLSLALWVLVTLELFRRICGQYRGIGTLARKLLIGSLLVSLCAALATIVPDISAINWSRPAAQLVMLLERSVFTVLAIFLFTLSVFLGYYHAPMRDNIVRHMRILALYFCLDASGTMAAIVLRAFANGPTVTTTMAIISRALLIGSSCCMVGWGLVLTRAGELEPLSLRLWSEDGALRIEKWDRDLAAALKLSPPQC